MVMIVQREIVGNDALADVRIGDRPRQAEHGCGRVGRLADLQSGVEHHDLVAEAERDLPMRWMFDRD